MMVTRVVPIIGEDLTGATARQVSVLSVGPHSDQVMLARAQQAEHRFITAELDEIATALDRSKIDVVVSLTMSRHFDCYDVAQILAQFDFKGRYVALNGVLPSPQMVAREVKARFPALDFSIARMPDALVTRMS